MNTGVGDESTSPGNLPRRCEDGAVRNCYSPMKPSGARSAQSMSKPPEGGTAGRMKWRAAYRPDIEDDTPSGRAALAELLTIARRSAKIIAPTARARLSLCRLSGDLRRARRARAEHRGLCADKLAGARLPHVWLVPGEISVHDRIADGFTLLRLGRNIDDASGLRKAFSAIGAPLSVLDIDSEAARGVYGFDYLLVRPDLHVVWRGDALPKDPAAELRALCSGIRAKTARGIVVGGVSSVRNRIQFRRRPGNHGFRIDLFLTGG